MKKTLIAKSKAELQKAIESKKDSIISVRLKNYNITNLDSIKTINNITIGLSPTMGALHNGHKSLIEANVKENDISIVSIFVNPTQFSPNEDLASYPRTFESDVRMCESLGVDVIFAPTTSEIYETSAYGKDKESNFNTDEITLNAPQIMGYILEGFYRPTHFAGVIQVVLKLLNLTQATRAYFGKKDAQQLLIIQKMTQNLFLKTQIIPIEIVRDSDNLALSSRNIYLDSNTRKKAQAIPKCIFHIESLIKKNVRDIATLKLEANKILKGLDIDYMDFFTHNLSLAKEVKKCIFLLAIRFKLPKNKELSTPKEVRLLDNLWID